MSDIQVWQRNYFENIIRSERALMRIQEYIAANPTHWSFDQYNEERTASDELGKALWRLLQEDV